MYLIDFRMEEKWKLSSCLVNINIAYSYLNKLINQTLDECAKRVLKNETNLSNIYLEQLDTFDDIKRDPRTRVVSLRMLH